MLEKNNKNAKKNFFPFNLGRRQLLKKATLIAVGIITTIADGILRRQNRQAHAMRSPTATQKTTLKQTRDIIADIWGKRTPHVNQWSVRVDRRTVVEPERWVQSACVLCSYGCALDIGVRDGKIVGVRGREGSFARSC
ncbi:hypothetical protein [Scytonema sp. NUACC26]|uniref:hypothetical protein n=1 Tax=Scytonema sp. NUACC26 TaxID=3140176 RepID=UPI0034DC6C77